MKGQLFVHIGPPKTATTSLQVAFANETIENLVYAGASQPERNNNDLSSRLHYCCRNPKASNPEKEQAIIDEIEMILNSGKSILISEELFLVDSDNATFQDKIIHLHHVIGSFTPTLILCIRAPDSGIRSLYQYTFRQVSIREKNNFTAYLKSNQAMIFFYLDLLNLLKSTGFESLFMYDFNDLSKERISTADILGADFSPNKVLNFSNQNISSRSITNGSRQLGKIYLRDFMPINTLRKFGILKFLRRNKLTKYYSLLTKIEIFSSKDVDLIIPTNTLNELNRQYDTVLSSYCKQTKK